MGSIRNLEMIRWAEAYPG